MSSPTFASVGRAARGSVSSPTNSAWRCRRSFAGADLAPDRGLPHEVALGRVPGEEHDAAGQVLLSQPAADVEPARFGRAQVDVGDRERHLIELGAEFLDLFDGSRLDVADALASHEDAEDLGEVGVVAHHENRRRHPSV
jgi:hypothetical protein